MGAYRCQRCGERLSAHGSHVPSQFRCSDGADVPWSAFRDGAGVEGETDVLRVVRLVEADMSEAALRAWRSADARRGLSDHDALLAYADTLTRWSERFRMAFDGQDYRDDRGADDA